MKTNEDLRLVEGLLESIGFLIEVAPGLIAGVTAFAGNLVEAAVNLSDDRVDSITEFSLEAIPH